jgi:hypothetical protein
MPGDLAQHRKRRHPTTRRPALPTPAVAAMLKNDATVPCLLLLDDPTAVN